MNTAYEFFTPVANLMRQAAETITELAQAELSSLAIQIKSDGTIVTKADGETERFLTTHLTRLLPDSKVLGEETSGDWRKSPLVKDAGDVWIMDPIDGTKPFSRGQAYGIMVALRRNNIHEAAWIYYPHTRDMLFATCNEKTCHVTWQEDGTPAFRAVEGFQNLLKASYLSHYCPPYEDCLGPYHPVAALFSTHAEAQCIATDVRAMLQDGTPSLLFVNHFTPWDHEITRLILEQAGGDVCFLRDGDQKIIGGILAPNTPTRERVLAAVKAVSPYIGTL